MQHKIGLYVYAYSVCWLQLFLAFNYINGKRYASRLYPRSTFINDIYMNGIHILSDDLHFILYAADTTLSSPMWSFSQAVVGVLVALAS